MLFCMVNDLDVAGKRKLLKMHRESSLKDGMLNAQASSFKVVLTYQGCLSSVYGPGMAIAEGGDKDDHGRHFLCPCGAQRLVGR